MWPETCCSGLDRVRFDSMATFWRPPASWMQFTEDESDHDELIEEDLGCSEDDHDGAGEEVDIDRRSDSDVNLSAGRSEGVSFGSDRLSFGSDQVSGGIVRP